MTDLRVKALDIENVSVSYGGDPVIAGIGFAAGEGEFFGLIGLNGAGKTTLIKAILGLRAQQTGRIRIFGLENTNRSGKRRLAYLPERFDPPWFLTGGEFVKFSLTLYGMPFDRDLLVKAAEELALDPGALDRRVQTYSKGMRQKLGLLGTLLTDCPLLILDEPMSGLDPLARTLVKDMLLKAKAAGRTIFLSSHILSDLDEICDRVAVLHEGHIKFTGTPDEMKKNSSLDNLERAFLHFIEKRRAA